MLVQDSVVFKNIKDNSGGSQIAEDKVDMFRLYEGNVKARWSKLHLFEYLGIKAVEIL